jgi:GNAT superfamily N-acetyltransferase
MNVLINGICYEYENDIRDREIVRKSFSDLAKQIFSLDFKPWYQNGFWQANYVPHVLLLENKVVSNISVNLIHTHWQGNEKLYIQLGTVMTDPDYRNRGLARWLMDTILTEWQNCDAVYLFANSQVLDFYPHFGFVKEDEYQYSLPFKGSNPNVKRLNMKKAEDVSLLKAVYGKGNPFSALPMLENTDLIMFYCSQYMKNSVYYSKELNAAVIADFIGSTMLCYDIFCDDCNSLNQILSVAAKRQTMFIKFGFTPLLTTRMDLSLLKHDDTLFLLSSKENLFKDHRLMFPALSHA